MPLGASADLLDFNEAVRWFASRVVIDEAQRHAIPGYAKPWAFWIANQAQARLVADVFDDLTDAIDRGIGFKQWAKDIRGKLDSGWTLRGAASAFRIETIWRNAAQHAYSRGRYQQISKPAMRKMRPYWMFDAVMDSRTSPICRPLDGTIKLSTDPWWDTHHVPLHHRCRSGIRTLLRSTAEAGVRRRDGTTHTPDDPLPTNEDGSPVEAQDGFGQTPANSPAAQHEGELPDDLRIELGRKLNASRMHAAPPPEPIEG